MNTAPFTTGYEIDYRADEYGPAYHAGPFWYRNESDRDYAARAASRYGTVTLRTR